LFAYGELSALCLWVFAYIDLSHNYIKLEQSISDIFP
jgi:hypothetical protein